jgi:hypothetical protein
MTKNNPFQLFNTLFFRGLLLTAMFILASCGRVSNKDTQLTGSNVNGKPFKEITIDVRHALKKRMPHISKICFEHKGRGYRFMGIHSKRAIENFHGYARVIVITRPDSSGVYEAKVFARGPDGIEVPKTGNGGKSTFFPDSWDEKKILDEGEFAVKHNKGFENGHDAADGYYGYSSDGKVRIAFYYNEKEGVIPSFFPSINK